MSLPDLAEVAGASRGLRLCLYLVGPTAYLRVNGCPRSWRHGISSSPLPRTPWRGSSAPMAAQERCAQYYRRELQAETREYCHGLQSAAQPCFDFLCYSYTRCAAGRLKGMRRTHLVQKAASLERAQRISIWRMKEGFQSGRRGMDWYRHCHGTKCGGNGRGLEVTLGGRAAVAPRMRLLPRSRSFPRHARTARSSTSSHRNPPISNIN